MIPRLTARFAFAHPAHVIALGFGTGLAPVAPGTVGTLLAFPIYMLLDYGLDPLAFYEYRAKAAALFLLIVVFFAIGVWACARTGRDLGVADHGAMNWDEVVAMLLVLLVAPSGWAWWAFAFFAFRFFDVIKPPPIGDIDREVKGGLGVMLDDLVAAFYTLLLIAVVKRVFF
jgi:phosphatidylglycerophosphatase A